MSPPEEPNRTYPKGYFSQSSSLRLLLWFANARITSKCRASGLLASPDNHGQTNNRIASGIPTILAYPPITLHLLGSVQPFHWFFLGRMFRIGRRHFNRYSHADLRSSSCRALLGSTRTWAL